MTPTDAEIREGHGNGCLCPGCNRPSIPRPAAVGDEEAARKYINSGTPNCNFAMPTHEDNQRNRELAFLAGCRFARAQSDEEKRELREAVKALSAHLQFYVSRHSCLAVDPCANCSAAQKVLAKWRERGEG